MLTWIILLVFQSNKQCDIVYVVTTANWSTVKKQSFFTYNKLLLIWYFVVNGDADPIRSWSEYTINSVMWLADSTDSGDTVTWHLETSALVSLTFNEVSSLTMWPACGSDCPSASRSQWWVLPHEYLIRWPSSSLGLISHPHKQLNLYMCSANRVSQNVFQ